MAVRRPVCCSIVAAVVLVGFLAIGAGAARHGDPANTLHVDRDDDYYGSRQPMIIDRQRRDLDENEHEDENGARAKRELPTTTTTTSAPTTAQPPINNPNITAKVGENENRPFFPFTVRALFTFFEEQLKVLFWERTAPAD